MLGRLSHRDRAAFAARCGRRVLPLFSRHWPEASARRQDSLTAALEAAEAFARGEELDTQRDVVLGVLGTAGAAYTVVIGTARLLDDDDEEPREPLPADGNRAAVAGAVAKAAENAARTAVEGEAKSVENAAHAWVCAMQAAERDGSDVQKLLDNDLTRLQHGKPLGRIREPVVNPKRWWQVWKR